MKIKLALACILVMGLKLAQAQVEPQTPVPSQQSTEASQVWAKEVFVLFKRGDYTKTLELLNEAEKGQLGDLGFIHYWKGLTYNRLAEYDRAISYLISASKSKSAVNYKDLYYELGQALYASQDYDRAVKCFMQAYRKGFKRPESLYYVAASLQESKKYPAAVKAYQAVTTLKETSKDLTQLSEFQIAEIYLLELESKQEHTKAVMEMVLPQLDKAYHIDEKSMLGEEITQRYQWIKRKYDLIPEEMYNGRIIPDKRTNLSFTQGVSYDSNVIQQASQTEQNATDQSSLLTTSWLYFDQKIPIKRRFFIDPKADIMYLRHYERDVPIIYQNDTLNLGAGATFSYEHRSHKMPASTFIDYNFDYVERDVLRDKKLRFFNKSSEYFFGHKFRKYSGDTTVKLKYKTNVFYNNMLDAKTYGLYASQIFPMSPTQLFMGTAFTDFNKVRDDTRTTQSYNFRGDFLYSSDWNKSKWHFYTTVMILDTKKQKDIRGTEIMLAPGASYSLIFGHFEWKLEYSYVKNKSESLDLYDYTKNVFALNLEVEI